jgi:hypothetical protein
MAVSFLSFSIDEKETKNLVKNMLYAPLGILQILRSAKSLNSRFTASLLAFLTALRSCTIQHFLKKPINFIH